MAVWQLLLAARRHLIILAIGTLMTVLAMVYVHGRTGLYQADMDIAVRPPSPITNRNPYIGRSYSLIATAGLLAKMATGSSQDAQTASSTITLAGRGVDDGFAVSLPNSGGQWSYDFDRPILGVQAVGRTPEEVTTNLNEATAAVKDSLAHLQDEAGVPESARIGLDLDPPTPQIGYSMGRPTRALGGTGLLGVSLTVAAILFSDDGRSRRRTAPLGSLRGRILRSLRPHTV